jgi:hypothetical protein
MHRCGDTGLQVQVQVHLHDMCFFFWETCRHVQKVPMVVQTPFLDPCIVHSQRISPSVPILRVLLARTLELPHLTPRLSAIRLGLTWLPEKYNYWKIFANLNFLYTKAKYDLL